MYLERSMVLVEGGLVGRTTCFRAGDGGGERRDSAAGLTSLTRSLLLCVRVLMLMLWLEVDVAVERLAE
jgi:hypothetical protein